MDKLRERVTIERRVDGPRYEYDGAAWVSVTPLVPADMSSNSEKLRWLVKMRKRDGIGATTRLIWRGRFLGVVSASINEAESMLMDVICEEFR